ncbi:4'-phosphopantetheinyl transferase family protein [Azospirillum argentinense]
MTAVQTDADPDRDRRRSALWPPPASVAQRRLLHHPVEVWAHEISSGLTGVGLWCCRTSDLDPAVLAEPERLGLFGDDDLRRCRRYHFDRDRHLFIAAHLLLRCVLSRYEPIEPAGWRFAANPYGRPEIADPAMARRLRFNLSHAAGLALVGVAREGEVGVDVECADRHADAAGIARHAFSDSERRFLQGLPADESRLAFLRSWTLKEAYAKARGVGLSLPFRDMEFQYGPDARIAMRLGEGIADRADRWRFEQFSLFDRHIGAVALGTPVPAG